MGTHPLRQYLKREGITQVAFASTIDVTEPYLSQIVNGRRTPGMAVARRIKRATGGEVGFDALLEYEIQKAERCDTCGQSVRAHPEGEKAAHEAIDGA